MSIDFSAWTQATADLPWGVQRAFLDSLMSVAEHDTHMVYGADYDGAFPCLVNTAAPMLVVGGGNGIPSQNFGEVVSAFDDLNRMFYRNGVNTDHRRVSPLAAEFLIRHFGELKPEPKAEDIAQAIMDKEPMIYNPEVSDEEFAQHLLTMGTHEPDRREQVVAEDRIDEGAAPRLGD